MSHTSPHPQCLTLLLPPPVSHYQGAAANFVETEQIVSLDGGRVLGSYVQVCLTGCAAVLALNPKPYLQAVFSQSVHA